MHIVYNNNIPLGDIDKDTVLVLASAVHFQNVWKQQFTETKKSSFCLSATKHIDITMMHQTGHFNYYKDNHNKFSAVEIPYKVQYRSYLDFTFKILIIVLSIFSQFLNRQFQISFLLRFKSAELYIH